MEGLSSSLAAAYAGSGGGVRSSSKSSVVSYGSKQNSSCENLSQTPITPQASATVKYSALLEADSLSSSHEIEDPGSNSVTCVSLSPPNTNHLTHNTNTNTMSKHSRKSNGSTSQTDGGGYSERQVKKQLLRQQVSQLESSIDYNKSLLELIEKSNEKRRQLEKKNKALMKELAQLRSEALAPVPVPVPATSPHSTTTSASFPTQNQKRGVPPRAADAIPQSVLSLLEHMGVTSEAGGSVTSMDEAMGLLKKRWDNQGKCTTEGLSSTLANGVLTTLIPTQSSAGCSSSDLRSSKPGGACGTSKAGILNALNSLREEFTCPVCFELLSRDTVTLSGCGHSFCRRCLISAKSGWCPSCRSPFPPVNLSTFKSSRIICTAVDRFVELSHAVAAYFGDPQPVEQRTSCPPDYTPDLKPSFF